MQLNKVLKGLVLVVPILMVAACGSSKTTDGDQSGTGVGSGTGINSGIALDEQARLQLQDLQRNNVVHFGFDRYDISSEYAQMLESHAGFLRGNPSYSVTIEGHADERGTPEYNIALGERRANAVKMYLQGKGVTAGQISIVSYGKEKPAVAGHNESAYSQNRRAVLVY